MKFEQASHLSYADLPIAYLLELGGEEFLGVRDDDGNFLEIQSLDEIPDTEWQQLEMFGPSLGLLMPCVADIVDEQEKHIGVITVRVIKGRPACASILGFSQGLTSSLLRQIPLASLVREAAIPNTVRVLLHNNRPFGARYVEGGPGFGQFHADLGRELAAVDERARRRVLDDAFLRMVAHVYRTALRLGISPAKHVEDMLGPISPAGARRWIAAARREGFLGPAPARGRAGELVHLGS